MIQTTPVKMTIIDIDDPGKQDDGSLDRITVQFNPQSFSRSIKAVYVEHEVLGGSFAPQEYVRTENQLINISLQYEAQISGQLDQLEQAERFIESFMYPPQATSFVTNAPDRMLLVWPNTLSLRCRLHTVVFNHNRFNRLGNTVGMKIDMTLKEVSVSRITKGLVQRLGALRSSTGVSADS